MIFISGDVHNDIDFGKIYEQNRKLKNELSRDDYFIFTGDWGIPWGGCNKETDEYLLRWIRENCKATILFVDGNHDNFDLLYSFPIIEKFGSKVHQLEENLFHLMRGYVYTIEEKTFFCFGGAESTDKHRRIEGISWWPQELPPKEEEDFGLINLEKVGNKVDYIITHDSPVVMSGAWHNENNSLKKYLAYIEKTIEYKKWFFGHYHFDKWITDKIRCIYNDFVRI